MHPSNVGRDLLVEQRLARTTFKRSIGALSTGYYLLDRSNAWSSATAAFPLLTSLRKISTTGNNDELALLQPSQVLICDLYLTIATKNTDQETSFFVRQRPQQYILLRQRSCYLLGVYENVTPLEPRGVVLHLAHKTVVGERPAIKSPSFVPTPDVSYIYSTVSAVPGKNGPFKNASSKAGDRAGCTPSTYGIEWCEDSRRFDSK